MSESVKKMNHFVTAYQIVHMLILANFWLLNFLKYETKFKTI